MFTKRSHRKLWRKAEDLLKYLYFRETDHTGFGMEGAPTELLKEKDKLLSLLRREGWVEAGSERLTEAGRQKARDLIRRHRLFEAYLSEKTGHTPLEWHTLAEGREHVLTDEDIRQLEAYLGFPLLDPHGDPIPAIDGKWIKIPSIPLDRAREGQVVSILHMEDEPPALMERMVEWGFYPGALLKILAHDGRQMLVAFEGERLLVPLEVARAIAVQVTEPIGMRRFSNYPICPKAKKPVLWL